MAALPAGHPAAALVQRLRSSSGSEQAWAAEQLGALARSMPGGMDALAAAGGLEALVQLLLTSTSTHSSSRSSSSDRRSSEAAQHAALTSLAQLMYGHAINQVHLVAAGGVSACVQLAQSAPSSRVQDAALRVLWYSCHYNAGVAAAVAASGVVPIAVSALGSSDAAVQSSAVGLLTVLSSVGAGIEEARAAGAIAALLGCLPNPTLAGAAVVVLASLAAFQASRAEICAWLRGTVRYMHDGSPAEKHNAAAGLAAVSMGAYPSLVMAMEGEGAVSALVQLVAGSSASSGAVASSASSGAVANALIAMHNLAGSPAGCNALLAADAATALAGLTSLQASREPAVKATAARALASLMGHTEQYWAAVANSQQAPTATPPTSHQAPAAPLAISQQAPPAASAIGQQALTAAATAASGTTTADAGVQTEGAITGGMCFGVPAVNALPPREMDCMFVR